jgi:hypothetical protein
MESAERAFLTFQASILIDPVRIVIDFFLPLSSSCGGAFIPLCTLPPPASIGHLRHRGRESNGQPFPDARALVLSVVIDRRRAAVRIEGSQLCTRSVFTPSRWQPIERCVRSASYQKHDRFVAI